MTFGLRTFSSSTFELFERLVIVSLGEDRFAFMALMLFLAVSLALDVGFLLLVAAERLERRDFGASSSSSSPSSSALSLRSLSPSLSLFSPSDSFSLLFCSSSSPLFESFSSDSCSDSSTTFFSGFAFTSNSSSESILFLFGGILLAIGNEKKKQLQRKFKFVLCDEWLRWVETNLRNWSFRIALQLTEMIAQRLWLILALHSIVWCGIWQGSFVNFIKSRKFSSTHTYRLVVHDNENSMQPKSIIIPKTSIQRQILVSVLQYRGGESKVSIISSIVSYFFRLLQQLFGIKPLKKYPKSKLSKKGAKPGKVSLKIKSNVASSPKVTSSGMARLQREMQNFLENPPSNCELKVDPKNIRAWTVTLTGADGTVYANEKYQLQMNFPKDYPAKPPSVFFLKPVPKHQHVYTNGDICLNLLGRDWRPILTAEGLAVSILSMLSSAKEKKLPQDNAMHAEAAPGQQQDNWMYHDDKC